MSRSRDRRPGVPELQQRLLGQIRAFGPPDGRAWQPPRELEQAFLDVPRHEFVRRFKVPGDDRVWRVRAGAASATALELVYRNTLLIHVDADGQALSSTNSEPAFILFLVSLLAPRPGDRVLEIGSGGGWLVAIVSRLVGSAGHVTGVEIIRPLARASRLALGRLGIENATIVSGDGSVGYPDAAPFDRIVFTAGAAEWPVGLVGQLAPGGRILVPLQVPGGGNEVYLLERTDDACLRAVDAVPGWFVPLQESGGVPPIGLEQTELWRKVGDKECARYPWSDAPQAAPFGFLTLHFRAFLSKVEPDLRLFLLPERLRRSGNLAFGIMDEASRSLALCFAGAFVGFGHDAAIGRLVRWRMLWQSLGCPMARDFEACVAAPETPLALPPGSWIMPGARSKVRWRLSSRRQAAHRELMAALRERSIRVAA